MHESIEHPRDSLIVIESQILLKIMKIMAYRVLENHLHL